MAKSKMTIDELNKMYGVGGSKTTSNKSGNGKQSKSSALSVDDLNRKYGVGEYSAERNTVKGNKIPTTTLGGGLGRFNPSTLLRRNVTPTKVSTTSEDSSATSSNDMLTGLMGAGATIAYKSYFENATFEGQTLKAYADAAKKATSNTYISSDLTEEQREKRKQEIIGELTEIDKCLGGLERAAMYGDVRSLRKKFTDRKTELEAEYKALERVGTFTASEIIQFQIDDLKEERDKLPDYQPRRQTMEEYEAIAKAAPRRAELTKQIEALEIEKKLYEDIAEYGDYIHNDDFAGQFGANYRSGALTLEADEAMGKYLNNPTEENKRVAYVYDALEKRYMLHNAEALDDKNVKLGWISKDLAGYLPQFQDRIIPEAFGYGAGAAVGAWFGAEREVGAVGAAAGTFLASYDEMKGSVYRALLAEGVDEETARQAASDEALISSLIESGETAISLLIGGSGKVWSAIKGAAKTSVAKGSTNAATKFIAGLATKSTAKTATKAATGVAKKTLWKTGANIVGDLTKQGVSEYAEEFLQQGVSIANRERVLNNRADDSLILGTGNVIKDALTGKNPDALAEMHEAGKTGFTIGVMMGGSRTTVNNIVTHYANAKTVKAQNEFADAIIKDKESLDALIKEGKASGEGSVSSKIAIEVEQAKSKGSVTREQVKKLIVSNDVYIKEEERIAKATGLKTTTEVSKPSSTPLSTRLNALSQANETISIEDVKKASGFGENGAKLLTEIASQDGMTFPKARDAMMVAYMSGYNGENINFSNDLQNKAMRAGIDDKIIDNQIALENAKNATVYKGAFTENEYTAKLTPETRKMVARIAKDFGMSIKMVDKIIANTVTGAEANASHVDGKMRISSTAEKLIHALVLHESGHRMEQFATKEWNALARVLYDRAERLGRRAKLGTSKGMAFDRMKAAHDEAGITKDTSGYYGEVVMQELETIFSSEEEFNKFIDEIKSNKEAKSALRKVMDFISELIEKVKKFIAETKMTKAEYIAAKDALAELEYIKELYAKAYLATEKAVAERKSEVAAEKAKSKSAKNLEIKTNKDYNGNINHSLKNFADEGYSTEGTKWAIANGLLTKNEQAKFWKDIANLSKRGYYIPKSKNGQYMIDVGPKLVFTNGNFKTATISCIIEFEDEYESNINDYKEWIIDEERNTAQHGESLQIIEIVQGEGYVREHLPSAYRTDARENGRRKGADSKRTSSRDGFEVNKSFSLKDSDYLKAVENNDMETAQRMVDEAAEKAFSNSKVRGNDGKLKMVYHGRVSDFNIFDRSFANIEGDFGKGYYFTSNEYDVEANYANEEGSDLKNKVARMAERLEWEDEYSDLSYEEREEIAKQKLITSEPSTITAYLNMENPVYINPNENGTFLDFEEEYDEEYDEYGEPQGLLIDFVEALNRIASDYAYNDVDFSFLYEYAYGNGGVHASDAVKTIKHRITDELTDDNGDLAVNEVIRLAFEEIGFDGIIDSSVYYKFNRMNGMDSGTTHYIVFNSNQIKSADAVTYDDKGNVIPLSQRFNEENDDIRYSLKDSQGNNLTKGQQDYFKDSKSVDENGNLLVMYQGSANDFTVFDRKKSKYSNLYGRGFYFTKSERHASQYGNTRAYYLDIKHPVSTTETTITKGQLRNFLQAVSENEDYSFENYGYGATVDSVLQSTYGKSDFLMLNDVSQTAIGDLVEAIELFNEINGTVYDGIILDTETVIFNSEQAKLTTNKNPTSNPDINFSLKKPVEETKNLIAVHNTTADKLLGALKLGGLPAPSIAITKKDMSHEKFGDISMVFRKDSISPTDRRNKIYSGDAYTPTGVRVEYDIDDDILQEFNKKLKDLTPEWANERLPSVDSGTANAENDSLYNAYERNDRAKLAFLREKGKAPKVAMRTPRLSNFVSNDTVIALAKAFSAKQLSEIANTSEGLKQYKNAFLKVIRDTEDSRVVEHGIYSAEAVHNFDIEETARKAAKVKENKYKIKKEVDNRATYELIDKKFTKALKAEYRAWIDENTKDAIVDKGIRNNRDLFTPSGSRRSFKQLHDPYNLSNIIKQMFSGEDKGIALFGGSPIGAAQHEYSSIADVKADSGRIQQLEQEEYDKIRDQIEADVLELAQKMKIRSDVFAIKDLLSEAIGKKTKQQADAYLKRESQGWANYSPEFTNELWDIKGRILNMPTGYFEAKPQRAVGFNEVVLAVLPKGMTELRKKLEDAGVQKVVYYDKAKDGDRHKKVNSVPDVNFSLKNTNNTDTKDRKELLDIIEHLKGEFEVTKFAKADPKKLTKLTKDLLKEYNSKADYDETRSAIDELYTYMANGENGHTAVWEDVYNRAYTVAQNIVENSLVVDDFYYQQYKSLRDYLRGTPIKFDARHDSVPSAYNDYNEFRKMNMGRLKFTKDGMSIDHIYQELATLYPEFFDAEEQITSEDQFEQIINVLDQIQPTEINPFDSQIEQVSMQLANDITSRFFDLPQAKPTFADKAERRVVAERIKSGKKVEAVRQQKDARIQKLMESQKAKTKKQLDKLREQRNAKVKKERDKRKTALSKMSEKQKAKVLRARIIHHTQKLSTTLRKATDKNHIPPELQNAVVALLSNINLESNYVFVPSTEVYTPNEILNASELYKAYTIASLTVERAIELDSSKKDVYQARADVIQYAKTHNDTAQLLGITPKDLNRKIKTWETHLAGKFVKESSPEGKEGLPTQRTEAFRALKEVYADIAKNNDYGLTLASELVDTTGDGVANIFDEVMKLSSKKIADMTSDELAKIYEAMSIIEHSIAKANKMFAMQRWEDLTKTAKAFELSVATRRPKHAMMKSHLTLDIETPLTFFSHFGVAGEELYKALRNAQDNEQRMIDELAERIHGIVSSEQVKKAEKEYFTFTTVEGKELTLSKAHIMDMYLLFKRKQGRKHLLYDPDSKHFGNGIHQPEIKGKHIRRDSESTRLTKADLGKIFSKLDASDKAIADKMQKATLLLAKWGNKASMDVFGYEKFNDTDYWTIKSASESINQTPEKNKDIARSIKNMGSAKSIEEKATNAVDIGGIFNVFNQHASDMICYSAWLGVMEDATKLYNYTFRDAEGNKTSRTFQSMLEKYAGEGGKKYYFNLLKDIQNGISVPPDTATEGIYTRLYGMAAKAAVAFKATVVAQQPMSIVRATNTINPLSILQATVKGGVNLPVWAVSKVKNIVPGQSGQLLSEWYGGWQKALKYSPIASRKAIGGYEINSNSSGLKGVLYNPDTIRGKMVDALKESPLWAAGKADELTWGLLWNACEIETRRKNKALEKGSEAYYEAVNELFTKVINETQVVDGVLQRSQLMRSSSGWIKPATSFTGEPTQALNAVIRAYDTLRYETNPAKRGKKIRAFGRATTVFLMSAVFTAFARSLAVGLTGEDEEEYWDKVWKSFSGVQGDEETWFDYFKNIGLKSDAVNNVNPFTWLPISREIMSMLEGYDVERLDVGSLSKFVKEAEKFIESFDEEGKYTVGYSLRNLLLKTAEFTGYSPYNLIKDIEGAIRTIKRESEDYKGLYEMEKKRTKPANNTSVYIDILYKAYSADSEDYEYIYDDLIKSGVDAETIESSMETRIMKAEGVTKTTDLAKRYMPPEHESTYDSSLKKVQSSSVWKSANAEQRKIAETKLYNFLTSTGKSMEMARADARAFGVDETEYTLLQLAMEMVDDKNNNNNSLDAKEKAEVIGMLDLGNSELAYFYGTKGSDEAYAHGLSIENYAMFKAAVSGLKGDNKKSLVIKYANQYADSEKEYLYFMGTEYSSYKKRSDYIRYFGK